MTTPAKKKGYGPLGRSTPCRHIGACNDWTHPRTLDEIIAERDTPPLKAEEIIAKWSGVFEPEFWEAVRSARDLP
jgi:hypothetical protein